MHARGAVAAEGVPRLQRRGCATVAVPGSKSITARATVLAALAAGRSILHGALESDDTRALAKGLSAMGAGVAWKGGKLVITGADGRLNGGADVNAGAGGTPARFLAAAAICAGGTTRIDGDARMRTRPMEQLSQAIASLGASVTAEGREGHLPLSIDGSAAHGGEVEFGAVDSSQFISALMLVGPFLEGGLLLSCHTPITSRPYVELTAGILEAFGAEAQFEDAAGQLKITVPQARLTARELSIEPDASSAIYFAAIAALHEGLSITIPGLATTSRQPDMAAITLLGDLGARIEDTPDGMSVTGTGSLRSGGEIDAGDFPDAALCLAAVMACADGPTTICGLQTLPRKESDRIEAIGRGLAQAGCGISSGDSFITIAPAQELMRAVVDPQDDHRVAMAMAVLGTACGTISITDSTCVTKSYPGFWSDLKALYEA